jgi:hypothetical protein
MILTGLAQSFGFAFFMRLLTGLGNGASYVPAHCVCRNWNRYADLRSVGSAHIVSLWRQWMAVFVVYIGRRCTFDIRYCLSVCAQQP